jgi:hypothetical protein
MTPDLFFPNVLTVAHWYPTGSSPGTAVIAVLILVFLVGVTVLGFVIAAVRSKRRIHRIDEWYRRRDRKEDEDPDPRND